MQRLNAIDPTRAEGKAKSLLDGVAKAMGGTPNIFTTIAISPVVLESYLGFNKALSAGRLGAKLREQIALAVAGANGCDYCASAHTAIGKQAGLADNDLLAGLSGHAADPKADAALQFARVVNDKRGQIGDADLARVRAAGYSDAEIAEIVANVAINVLTNYFNNVALPEIDFPVVHARQVA